MRKNLFLVLQVLLIFSAPFAYSITWKEIFDAVKKEKFDFPVNARNKQVNCYKDVYWEEYIEGNSFSSGYVKEFRKKIKINCPY